MIPKILHYCWFGSVELPALESSCVESWNTVMPDYEIRRWDETNFDIERCIFSREAYEQGKYAFVSDYARYVILREYGGFFLDTDIKTLKSYSPLLRNKALCGFMQNKEYVAPGLILAGEKAHPLFDEVIERYESKRFLQSDNRVNPLSSPRVLTSLLEENHGLRRNGTYQELDNGLVVYPAEYFDPLDSHSGTMYLSENTYSVHLYSGTWLNPAKKYRIEMRKRLAPKVGPKLSWLLSSALSVVKYGRKAF